MDRFVFVCAALTAALGIASTVAGGSFDVGQIILWSGLSVVLLFWLASYALISGQPLRRIKVAAITLFLAGAHLAFYNSIKHQLNSLPFTHDKALADLDALLFFGDPWVYLAPLNEVVPSFFYYYGWIVVVAFGVGYCAAFDARRSILIPLYFACWAIIGPLLHILMPAAGPVFYERLGLGDRFSGIAYTRETAVYSDYLWQGYVGDVLKLGGGISAMPSLHVMMATWVAIVFSRTRIAIPVYAWALLIFLMSIATGWHYAVDGIVSSAVVFAIYAVSRRIKRARGASQFWPRISRYSYK